MARRPMGDDPLRRAPEQPPEGGLFGGPDPDDHDDDDENHHHNYQETSKEAAQQADVSKGCAACLEALAELKGSGGTVEEVALATGLVEGTVMARLHDLVEGDKAFILDQKRKNSRDRNMQVYCHPAYVQGRKTKPLQKRLNYKRALEAAEKLLADNDIAFDRTPYL